MSQINWWSKHGMTVIAVATALALVGVVIWLNRPGSLHAPERVPSSAMSPTGWEIRYNATLALARRGSDKVPLDELQEMLNEDQQLRNFTAQTQNGEPTADEQAARMTVIKALEATGALHQKQPKLDLRALNGAIDKLTHSANLTVREKAQATQKELAN